MPCISEDAHVELDNPNLRSGREAAKKSQLEECEKSCGADFIEHRWRGISEGEPDSDQTKCVKWTQSPVKPSLLHTLIRTCWRILKIILYLHYLYLKFLICIGCNMLSAVQSQCEKI